MMRWLIPCLLAAPAFGQTDLPSGLEVTPLDVLTEDQPGGETWLVLRYIAPAIADGAIAYEDVVDDLDTLCVTDGLPDVEASAAGIDQITVVLLDRPVERGVPDEEATQYIGAYLPGDGECIWNDF